MIRTNKIAPKTMSTATTIINITLFESSLMRSIQRETLEYFFDPIFKYKQ